MSAFKFYPFRFPVKILEEFSVALHFVISKIGGACKKNSIFITWVFVLLSNKILMHHACVNYDCFNKVWVQESEPMRPHAAT